MIVALSIPGTDPFLSQEFTKLRTDPFSVPVNEGAFRDAELTGDPTEAEALSAKVNELIDGGLGVHIQALREQFLVQKRCNSGCWMTDSGCWALETRGWMSLGYRIQDGRVHSVGLN